MFKTNLSKFTYSLNLLPSTRKLKIQTYINPVDWMSFHQIYVPILAPSSTLLYTTLFFQKQINTSLGIKSYDLDLFLKNYQLSEAEFKDSLRELERLELAKVYIQKTIESETEFTIKLEEIKSIEKALKNDIISSKLKSTLTPEKYSELKLLIEDIDYGYEVDLSSLNSQETPTTTPDTILDEETYCTFYNGIFRSLNSQFSLSDDVLRIVRDYHLKENKISMEQLQHFSLLSIKEVEGKYILSPEHLQFLVNQSTSKKEGFNEEDYDDFWRELLVLHPREIQSKFTNLFTIYDSEELYRLLTVKGKVPATLNKWIRDCIRNKNLNFPILNASISFVKTLLKKVPINYLIKLTETLYINKVSNEIEFLDHIRKVIAHDSQNQNRINAKIPEISSNLPILESEPCFFSKKTDY